MKKFNLLVTPVTIVLIAITLFMRCGTGKDKALTPKQSAEVLQQVQQMADNIARDVSEQGPTAWLTYFADEPQFFMVSNGELAFTNYDSASVFIKSTLSKTMPAIHLSWNNVRIDPVTENLAVMGAYFHETITDGFGKHLNSDGYFTGTAEKTDKGWQLRNAHWSVNPTK